MRKADVERNTKETRINISFNIDGHGKTDIKTGIDFLDHMLDLFGFHGLFDIKIKAKGDTEVDIHHTNEDIGIVLGQAFKKSLGEGKKGIKRFGFAYAPMGKALARVVIDICGRGEVNFTKIISEDATWEDFQSINRAPKKEDSFDALLDETRKVNLSSPTSYNLDDLCSFFDSFAKHAGTAINIGLLEREDFHHQAEAVFKAFGIALDQATQIDPRRKGIPSTKGVID
ncbi:MAG: imidazoleglycerol-phosphate dehydratase [Candidatus Omnitrophica bacterium]|nr:imidazoleglycerol-phosphate dehydratase [Candidatus Omnitrophota bacterium]